MRAAAKWQSLPLTEAFWFQEGPGVRNWQFTTSGIKLLNVANIEKGGTLNLEKTDRHLDESEVAKKYSHFLVDVGDLVIASSGISFDDDGLLRTRGAFVRCEHLPLCLNTSTIRFKAIDGVSDLRFLRLWLDSREFRSQITKFVTGTAQQNFGPSHLKATKIALPPLAEQRRIAEVLDCTEALRAKRSAALAQLDFLTQSLFLDLFGALPWKDTARLDEVAELKRGPFGGALKKEIFVECGYKVYEQKNAIQNDFRIGRYFISDRKFKEMADFAVIANDLIVSCSGTFGKVAIAPTHAAPGIINQALLRVRPNSARVTSLFLKHALEQPAVQARLARYSHGTGLQNFPPMAEVRALRVPAPSSQLQREFSHRVSAVEKLKTAQRASLAELDALFATLQHRAFRGEL